MQWKTQQWPQDWKRSVFIPIPKKGNVKECSNSHTIALISHASKVMLKILQARLQQYVNREIPDVQAGFRKDRGTRDQIATQLPCSLLSPPWTTYPHLCFSNPLSMPPRGFHHAWRRVEAPDLSPALSSLPQLQLQGPPCSTPHSSSTQASLPLSQVQLKAPPQTAFLDHAAQEPFLPRVTLL